MEEEKSAKATTSMVSDNWLDEDLAELMAEVFRPFQTKHADKVCSHVSSISFALAHPQSSFQKCVTTFPSFSRPSVWHESHSFRLPMHPPSFRTSPCPLHDPIFQASHQQTICNDPCDNCVLSIQNEK
jgi:hypothetical protein